MDGGAKVEIRRIFFNKKFVILFIVLLLVNAGWYLNEERKEWDLDHITMQDAANYQKEYLKRTEDLSPQEAYNYLEQKSLGLEDYIMNHLEKFEYQDPTIYQKVAIMDIVDDLAQQMKYLAKYQDYLKGIRQQAGVMSTISIFKQEDSFSSKNIEKTVQDYKPLDDISLERGINQPIVGTLFDPMLRFINVIFIFALVLSFIEERKHGLWEKVHTTPGGRGKLALRRGGILFVSSLIVQMLTLVERLALSSSIYGNLNLARKIQSIPEFKDFVFPMSITSYLLLYWIICSLAGFCLGLFLWLVLSAFLNRVLSFALICVVETIEWVAYTYIPVQSSFGFLKYFNLHYLINPTRQLASYSNIGFFGRPVERLQVLMVTLIIMGTLFFILSIWLNKTKKPVEVPSRLERIVGKVIHAVGNNKRKLLAKLSFCGTELYKILGPQKGMLIILVMLLYLFSDYRNHDIFFGPEQKMINEFYENYGGKLDEKTLLKMEQMSIEVKQSEDNYEKAYTDNEADKLTKEEMKAAEWLYKNTGSMRGTYFTLQLEIQRLLNLEESREIKPVLVNNLGYNLLLGERGFPRQFRRAMLEVFVLILLISAIFSQERVSRAKLKIRTTVKGRRYFFWKKIQVIAILSFVTNLLVWGYEWIYYGNNFPLAQLGAPVQSIALLEFIPFTCSIAGFMVLLLILKWLLLMAVGMIISLVSTRFSQIGTLSITSLLFLGPGAFSLLDIQLFKKISVVEPIAMMEGILSPDKGALFVIHLLIILTLGIGALFIGKKQWCTRGIEYEAGN